MEMKIKSAAPMKDASINFVKSFFSVLFLNAILFIIAPKTSILREVDWILVAAIITSSLFLVAHTIVYYLKMKSSTLHCGEGNLFVLKRRNPWPFKKAIPCTRIRHISTEQKLWQRKMGLVSVEIFSLGNDSASIEIESITEEEAEQLQLLIESVKQDGAKHEV